MSQEKVNQYKEQKKNRKDIVKKEKRKAMLMKVCACAVLLLLAAWIIYSAVITVQNAEGPEVSVDASAVTEYLEGVE